MDLLIFLKNLSILLQEQNFENAKSTKMVHIAEFTADLIKHGKLELDKSRNSKSYNDIS